MIRKVNKYFVTIPVDDWQTAQSLGSETNWKILEVLREVGMNGLTAEEISEKINVPRSSIYGILSKLTAAQMVESTMRRPHWGRPSKEIKQRFGGKPTRVFIQKVPWGYSEFDEEFIESLEPVLKDMEKSVGELGQKWLSILDKIASTYQTDDLKKFYPQDAIHEAYGCGRSHEGFEFLYAVSLALLWKIMDSKHFEDLAKKHGFMK
jgi:predicted ArsR family transcriptional regulator